MGNPTTRAMVKRAQAGTITEKEVGWAADMLRRGGGGHDRWDLLEIVGNSSPIHYEELVASFLECPQDPWASRIALQILCNRWGLAEKYVEVIRRFLAGVPWDNDGDVRDVAISRAGAYLREHDDEDLLRRLWDIAHLRGPRYEVTDDWIEAFGAEGAARLAEERHVSQAEWAIEALEDATAESWGEIYSRKPWPTKEAYRAYILRRVEEKFGPLA
jgi:hypothetical protein